MIETTDFCGLEIILGEGPDLYARANAMSLQSSSNVQAIFLIYTGGLNGAVPEIPENFKTPGP